MSRYSLLYRLLASISGLWGEGYGLVISLPVAMVGGKTCRGGSVHVPSKPGAINGMLPEQVKFLNNQIMKLRRTSQTIFKEIYAAQP